MSEERMNPNFNLESCLRNKVNEAKRYLEDKHKRQKDGACEESSYAESFIYYFQHVETILDLYKKEKEDNKLYKLCTIQDQDFRDRLIDILGVGDNEETILQHIATLVSKKKGIDELTREKQDLKTELYMNSVSKDKIRGIFNNKIMKEKENLEQIFTEENINKAFTINAIESKINALKKLEKELLEEE